MKLEYSKELNREEINQYPLYKYTGEIIQVRTKDELEQACAYLETVQVLGFDTETKPSFRKGTTHDPALLQLACSSKVYLFFLRQLEQVSPLLDLLTNPKIIKAGIAVADDIRFLKSMYAFEAAGMFDLAITARKNNIKLNGLRGLAASFLGVRISKSARCSNWNNPELTTQQISYAATDAWISRKLYLRMQELGLIN